MEAFQPFLIALLALNMAAFIALLMRTVREGRERRQEQAVIDAATHRVQSRLAAIRDPSIPPGSEPTYEPGITVVDVPRSIPTVAEATTSRRRVWSDAAAAIAVFVCIALVVVFAAPSLGLSPTRHRGHRRHPRSGRRRQLAGTFAIPRRFRTSAA
jgi:hypothetical protein